MVSPFFFAVTIIPILLLAFFLAYRGFTGHAGSYILSGICFLIVSIYLFAFGIPSEPLVTTTVVSATVTTNVVTYTSLKASNDPVVNGLAYLFASFALLNLGLSIPFMWKSISDRLFPSPGDGF